MRVILGKAGKSRVLDQQLKQLNQDRILMIDSVHVHGIANGVRTIRVKTWVDLIKALEQLEKETELLKVIDVVVLELNTGIENTDVLLEWEKRLNKKFIVTIQDNEVDHVMVFDMSLPE
jgi:hypothetical protein